MLHQGRKRVVSAVGHRPHGEEGQARLGGDGGDGAGFHVDRKAAAVAVRRLLVRRIAQDAGRAKQERKRVVQGTGGSVRVVLGGRRLTTKTHTLQHTPRTPNG